MSKTITIPVDLAKTALQFLSRVQMNGQEALPFVQVTMGISQAIQASEAPAAPGVEGGPPVAT